MQKSKQVISRSIYPGIDVSSMKGRKYRLSQRSNISSLPSPSAYPMISKRLAGLRSWQSQNKFCSSPALLLFGLLRSLRDDFHSLLGLRRGRGDDDKELLGGEARRGP